MLWLFVKDITHRSNITHAFAQCDSEKIPGFIKKDILPFNTKMLKSKVHMHLTLLQTYTNY